MTDFFTPIRGSQWGLKLLGIALAFLSAGPSLLHGQPGTAADPTTQPATAIDAATAERLIRRLDAQEAEIKELRERLARQAAPAPVPAAPTTAPTTVELKRQLDDQQTAVTDLKSKVDDVMSQEQQSAAAKDTYPTLQFHAFADIDYHVSNNKADHDTFTLAEFDVFVQSQISDQWSILTETVLSADNTNTYGIEVERLLAQYKGSDFFNVDIGRYHTAIGYYNTAYHHGVWFQTAENRPFFLQFEDSGGIIAAHSVGVSVHGAIPSGALGLTYYAEIGNGRQWVSPTSPNNAVGNVLDDNDYKAFNFALVSRPEDIPGLQLGAGVYIDRDTPSGVPRTDETMLHSHLVYKNADWEFLSEALLIDHKPTGSATLWSYAYYVQLARKFGPLSPYVRFSYLNANSADPLYQLGQYYGRHYGPSIGCRYDLSDFIALKLEYDYFINHGPATQIDYGFSPIRSGPYSEVTAQLAFTF